MILCRMFELLGYKPEHLLGKSLYDYHHGNDSDSLMTSFKCRKFSLSSFALFYNPQCQKTKISQMTEIMNGELT